MPKKCVVQRSTIPNAGDGLFLCESAKEGERVARYSGVVLNREEIEYSKSKYILMISKDVFLDAEHPSNWEGRSMNCGIGHRANVRFGASRIHNTCRGCKRAWISVFALRNIFADEDNPKELLVDYGEKYLIGGRVVRRVPTSHLYCMT